MVIDLTGKVAVVSGSSRGIGRACAVELGRSGADVVVNYRSHADDAEAAAAAIRDAGSRAVVVQADVSTREGCAALIDAATEHFGRLDIVVANAVKSIRKPVAELSADDVAQTWDATLWHGFHLSQLATAVMRRQGQGGRIILMSSVHASYAYPNALTYNVAKAGLNHMARSLATELASDGILVNAVEPGWINTEGERTFFSDEQIRELGRTLPLGRLGTPEEIAWMVVFLASAQGGYITGSVMRVDGGFVLPRGL